MWEFQSQILDFPEFVGGEKILDWITIIAFMGRDLGRFQIRQVRRFYPSSNRFPLGIFLQRSRRSLVIKLNE